MLSDTSGLPLVSVVTVTYNSAAYVRDAIESVLAQSYTRIEYIISDDASTDRTWDIVSEYRDARIRAIRNPSNLGEYANRNRAIELATGDYLVFIDGDDVIYSHGIELFVRIADAFPQAALLVQKGYINNIVYPALLTPSETIRNYFYGQHSLLTSSLASNFFVTRLLKAAMLDPLFRSADEEIRVRMAASHPVLFIAGWMTWPRETPNQASSRIDEVTALEEFYRYSSKQLPLLRRDSFEPGLADDVAATIKRRLSRAALRHAIRGRLSAARRLLRIADVRWTEALTYARFRPIFADPLAAHSAANPFRRNALPAGRPS